MELIKVSLSDLIDHPQNPRVVMREDVVESIAVQLKGDGEFSQKHAVHVRPIDGGYQIISGHHRKAGAARAGLDSLWAWSEEMDDETAFMALVLSNAQGELDPLEIGIHAFQAVPVAKGGRGKKGGLSEYAGRISKDQGNLTRLRDAGEVVKNVCIDTYLFLGKAQHLAAIHKLPKGCWQAACEWLSDGKDSDEDKENKRSVARVKERIAIAMEAKADPLVLSFESYTAKAITIRSFLDGKDISKDVKRICDLVIQVKENLDEDLRSEFHSWFVSDPIFDIKLVQQKRIEIEGTQWERDNESDDNVEQELVSLLLADPPWKYDFAETDSRQIENQYPTADAETIGTHLDLPWAPKLADDCVLFMWATAPKLREAFVVIDAWGFEYKTHAVWDKEKIGMGYWFRGQHELLIVATRGSKSPPEPNNRFASVFREARDAKHSKKPTCVYEAIEKMFPNDVKFEMYAREHRDGWLQGGNDL